LPLLSSALQLLVVVHDNDYDNNNNENGKGYNRTPHQPLLNLHLLLLPPLPLCVPAAVFAATVSE